MDIVTSSIKEDWPEIERLMDGCLRQFSGSPKLAFDCICAGLMRPEDSALSESIWELVKSEADNLVDEMGMGEHIAWGCSFHSLLGILVVLRLIDKSLARMNTGEEKKVIREYLGGLLRSDLREQVLQTLLEDNIDIARWAKNMEFLKGGGGYTQAMREFLGMEGVDPLVARISCAKIHLPLIFGGIESDWFIAGYPDVVNYFFPSADGLYVEPKAVERTEGELLYRKLMESQEWLHTDELNSVEFLLYLKRYYKDELKKRFSLATE